MPPPLLIHLIHCGTNMVRKNDFAKFFSAGAFGIQPDLYLPDYPYI